ncbi:MAG TPA: MFS transporter [Mycobacterium sp.]|nr:MFS transporter [Mycobacterium sp.]
MSRKSIDASFLLLFGFCWSVLSVSHQFAVQAHSPAEMRGLMTSTYTLVVQGSMALGSFGFGVLAQRASVSRSILSASFVAAAGLVLVRLFPMPESVAKASAT